MDLAGFRLLDGLTLSAALRVSSDLLLDRTALTEYRAYLRNASMNPESRADQLAARAALSRIILPSYERLADIVRTHGNAAATEEAEGLLEIQRAYLGLRDSSMTRQRVALLRKGVSAGPSTYFVKSEGSFRHAPRLFSVAPFAVHWWYAREVRRSNA